MTSFPTHRQPARLAEQNTHDRGPQRWPSRDLDIYARDIYTERVFAAQAGTISRVRGLIGILTTQCRQRLNYRKDRIGSAALTSCVRQIACAPIIYVSPERGRCAVTPKALIFCCPFHQPFGDP
jgi:hypothetical protein